jgi:hypothetical protein
MAKAKAAAATEQAVNQVTIPRLQRVAFELVLYGETPLIVNAWTQKAKLEMLKKHMQIPTIREAKDPYEQFLATIYRFEDGEYGFPVVGVKEAMATATTDIEGIFKTQIYRNIFVTGRRGFQVGAFCDLLSPIELAEVFSPNPPTMREDVVRLAGMQRTPDLRYRAEFSPWALRLKIAYFDRFIRDTDILNLVEKAGMTVGLGEWRQEKGGNSGMFHVASEDEKKQVAKWVKAGHQEPVPIDVAAWRADVETREMEKIRAVEAVKGSKRPRSKGNGAEAGSVQ